jgi:hypothetical protein
MSVQLCFLTAWCQSEFRTVTKKPPFASASPVLTDINTRPWNPAYHGSLLSSMENEHKPFPLNRC